MKEVRHMMSLWTLIYEANKSQTYPGQIHSRPLQFYQHAVTKMKLQIMSDAHMQVDCGFGGEYGKFDFPAAAPNLVLLGGMGRICDAELQDFIVLQLTRFERIFYVMGMDEFYQSTIPVGRRQMQEFAENLIKSPPTKLSSGEPINKIGTFHYLHRTRVDVEDVTILGCTLWRGWKKKSNQAREACGGYRPIQDFFAEEETIERDLDLAWLQSQLQACANGEAAVAVTHTDEAVAEPLEQPPVDPAVSAEEVDIYDDVAMSPPTKKVDWSGDQSSEKAPPVNQPPPEPSESTLTTKLPSSKRQGPPRRVVILTVQPPTFKGTTAHRIGPAIEGQTKEAAFVLQDRQCWALGNGYGNGVVVSSHLHGSNDPRPQAGDSMLVEAEQSDTKMSETPSCGHDNGFTGDPYRPPGVALWAFGYTEWSCDTGYEAPMKPFVSDLKGKKPEAAEQPTNKHNRCPQCNRVPAPIRLINNQCGQQWERKCVPYVDVPPTWRAFDEAFVVDV
ncbi:unnamed protein product [Rhizoctonia solani]|uniref:Uncharacterized protein n=1 Tax=Rhizoctonia solani TaxID=456999 RepID=A0A8H2XAX0_9AGAM|nr:unnamed protein product [Rhizoctonia solani]